MVEDNDNDYAAAVQRGAELTAAAVAAEEAKQDRIRRCDAALNELEQLNERLERSTASRQEAQPQSVARPVARPAPPDLHELARDENPAAYIRLRRIEDAAERKK